MFVPDCASDLVVELLVREGLYRLQTLVRQSRPVDESAAFSIRQIYREGGGTYIN